MLLGLVMWTPPAWQGLQFQTPRRKAGVGVRHPSQLRHREPCSRVPGMVRTVQKSKFPDSSQGPASQTGSSEDGRLRPAVVTVLPTHLGVGVLCPLALLPNVPVGADRPLPTKNHPAPNHSSVRQSPFPIIINLPVCCVYMFYLFVYLTVV